MVRNSDVAVIIINTLRAIKLRLSISILQLLLSLLIGLDICVNLLLLIF